MARPSKLAKIFEALRCCHLAVPIIQSIFPRQVVTTVMGDGEQRQIDCPDGGCDGPAQVQRLLAPKAVAAAPDGSVYVADYNLLRRITPDGHVTSLLRLK